MGAAIQNDTHTMSQAKHCIELEKLFCNNNRFFPPPALIIIRLDGGGIARDNSFEEELFLYCCW